MRLLFAIVFAVIAWPLAVLLAPIFASVLLCERIAAMEPRHG